MSSDDLAQFLADSPDRQQLLTHLADHPGSPAELADALTLSRRSIQRHLSQFVEQGWAIKENGIYHLTTTGELIVTEHTTYLDSLERIETYHPFFIHLPDTEHTPDPRWLESATLVTATEDHPQAPVNEYLERVQTFETDHIRMVAPVLSRLFHNVHAELAMDGVHTELVMDANTISRARDLNPTEFKLVVSVHVLDLYRFSDDINFGLTIGDDQLLMGAYDNNGRLQACVHASNPEFLHWGETLFERYRDQAELIETPISLPFTSE